MENLRPEAALREPPIDFSDQIAKVEVLMMVAGLTWRSPLIHQWLTQWLDQPTKDWCSFDDMELLEERLCIELIDGGLGRA
ncbi:hypothetical protein N836_34060 [Leptolyngbya sp. Heron Island J]|uniref:hypothetical protein n=1 Tax=Leptolyngbya sp. Heron Island J TaxID=1385935 RepID=UPI0003B9E11C|nr:hypothetical protein [Leptolyngbya sp. Heron Island J]ESA38104.1 hypothetical protein N836_34060 [Leptolyngbya sp. Heron Island J]